MTQPYDLEHMTGTTLTDDQLAAFIRDAADGWQMPPVALNGRGWQERVRTRGPVGFASGSVHRLGRALTLAIALVVAAAITGVVLSRLQVSSGVTSIPRPPDKAGVHVSQPPSSPSSNVTGAGLVSPMQFVVAFESGYALVDLATGTVGSAVGLDQWGSMVRQAADGSLVCLCLSATDVNGSTASYSVEWRRLDSKGSVLERKVIGTYSGTRDPRTQSQDGYQDALVETSDGPGNVVYVGWSTREHPVWHSGIVAVDISSGEVLGQLDLPDRDDGPADAPVVVNGPTVVGSAGPGRVLINRGWYSFSPAITPNPVYQPGFDAFTASSTGATLGDVTPRDGLAGCGDFATNAGSFPDGGTWAACWSNDGPRVRRFGPDGAALGDTRVPQSGALVEVDRAGSALYGWDPTALTLVRVDLRTGQSTVAVGKTAGADLLARIGDWLAPPAAAKVWLTPSFAVSPDGSRVYALGITGPGSEETVTSTGLYVFDTSTMDLVAHWPATADYQSIATSADGGLVFLAAAPVVGSQPFGGTVTVLDASTGEPRRTFTGLGFQPFFFTSSQLP